MANQVTTTFRIDAQGAINSLNQYNTQLQKTIQLQKQLGGSATAIGGGGVGVGGGAAGGGIGGIFSGLRGLAGPLAGVVSFAAVTQGLKSAVEAGNEATKANRALSASAVEAGKSYAELATASANFAKSAGISTAEASRSTSQLQRLVSAAGKGDELERYQQGFLDLAAARGVQFDELNTLFQGILAGTDDALNRFGKSDPAKLYAIFAEQLGKSVEQLTAQEKVLALLSAFENDFSIFTGANEERLKTFDGRLDKFNASLTDTLGRFGQWITSSYLLGEALQFVNEQLGDTATQQAEQKKEIEKRLLAGEAPKQITRSLVDRGFNLSLTGGLIENLLRYSSAEEEARSQVALGQKNITATEQQKAKNLEKERQDRILASLRFQVTVAEQAYKFEQQTASATLSLIEAKRKSILDGTFAAELRYNAEVSKARIDSLNAETNAKNAIFSARIRLAKEEGKQDEINNISRERNLFEQQQLLAIQLEQIAAQQKQADIEKRRAEAIKQVTKDLRGQALGYAGEQNPYVKIFTDAQTSAEDLIEKTKEFGTEFQNSMLKGIGQRMGLQLLTQDISNLRSATTLRREAFEIGAGFDPSRLSGRRADAYRRQVIADDLNAIERAYQRRAQTDPLEAQRARDRAIIEATQGATPRQLTSQTRQLAVEAREREAERLERDRDQARNVFDTLIKEFSGGGVRVRIAEGEQYVYVVNKAGDKAEVASKPGQGSTNQRYGR